MKNKKKVPIDIVLFIILILSILEIILFIVLKAGTFQWSVPALCKFFENFVSQYLYVLEIVNNLSLTYIMSYIFYIVALIPERKKQKSINKYVAIYLTNISRLFDEIISVSKSFINEGEKILEKSPNSVSMLRRDTGRFEFLTYKEHFIKFYKQFKEEYQHLAYYIVFVDDDLRECLYEIVTSDFLGKINELLVNSKNNEYDKVFEENFDISEISGLNAHLKHML